MANRIIPYDPFLKGLARKLRKAATPGEIALWKRIRRKALGVEFHRQAPIDKYIVDFYCHELQLGVEIDGDSHDDTIAIKDLERQAKLESLGLRLIRFTEKDALHRVDIVLRSLTELIAVMEENGRPSR